MNASSQTIISNLEIEWSELLCLLSAFPRVVAPSLFVWVCALIVKNAKTVGRENKRKKDTYSIAKIRTPPSPPAVTYVCRKLNQAAKGTNYKIRFISENYVTIT